MQPQPYLPQCLLGRIQSFQVRSSICFKSVRALRPNFRPSLRPSLNTCTSWDNYDHRRFEFRRFPTSMDNGLLTEKFLRTANEQICVASQCYRIRNLHPISRNSTVASRQVSVVLALDCSPRAVTIESLHHSTTPSHVK
jgi:hypothetical protein